MYIRVEIDQDGPCLTDMRFSIAGIWNERAIERNSLLLAHAALS